jgi:hypothetical protein
MPNYPLPPADMVVMAPDLQHQFTMMQIPPIIVATLYVLWCAYKHRSLVPVWIYLGGGIAYMAEPLVNVLGMVWYPKIGINAVFESLGRPVPLFGFLAYAWFQGALAVFVYDRLTKGTTIRGIWTIYGAFVATMLLLEIPGLNMGAYTYYGNQPFVLLRYPVWWAFVNSAAPVVAGALAYRMRAYVKPALRPIFIYASCFSNCAVMFSAACPLFFVLNTPAGLGVTHLAGTLTIATAAFWIYMVTLITAKDSPAVMNANWTDPAL